MGSENGAMSYNAQRLTQNHHLGDDLNGIGGEDSDLGDPIYAVANGRVLLTRDGGPGWGKVIIVLPPTLKMANVNMCSRTMAMSKRCSCRQETK